MTVAAAAWVVVHDKVPGRLRLRSESLRARPDLAGPVQERCARAAGVIGARVNAVTGSLLLTYEDPENTERVLASVERALREVMDRAPGRSLWVRELALADDPPNAPRRRPRERRRATRDQAIEVARSAGEEPTWHALDSDAVLMHWRATTAGLTAPEAADRLARYGLNALEPPAERSTWSRIFEQFANVPVALLGASAVLSAATGGIGDAVAIGAVVLMNAAIGYVTESEADKTLSLLGSNADEPARVLRDGVPLDLHARHVCAGDILLLAPGDFVAADARLLEADRLLVDESTLTGESVPVEKLKEALPGPELPLADRRNMVYRGTIISGGSGRAVVVATGVSTEIGRVQQLAGSVEARETPLQAQLRRLGMELVIGSALVCGGVFVIGLLRGQRLLDMLKTSVSLAVAAVPEGLPTVAITTLALGIRRMRQMDVIVRQLGAVETLGALEVLCLDKTGTITQNRMTVVSIHAGQRSYQLEEGRFSVGGQPVAPDPHGELARLLELVSLCSEVELVDEGVPRPALAGSPTETALVEAAFAAAVDVAALRSRLPRTAIGYRTQARNYMFTVHDNDGEPFVAVKGSPSEVLDLCTCMLADGETRPLDEDARNGIETNNERMAGLALRVLGVACRRGREDDLGDDRAPDPTDFTWVGLIGMVDPPRPNIGELLRRFHAAGIRTVMITGDQSATAQSVAKQIGLTEDGSLEILDSTRLEKLDPEVLRPLASQVDVFARVSPTHKLQIVQALQASGLVVAMTGDGINDGPALKAADVGVALGKTGTAAAREVADVVLTTDDLHALITAVEQGRAIYDDIRKALRFILATNLSEILVTFTAVAAGFGQVLTPMQLLWINILSDVFPELGLAVQPPEEEVLARPPRDPKAPMFSRADLGELLVEGTIISLGAAATYGYGLSRYGVGARAGTLAFASLTSAQLLHAFSARSEHHTVFDEEHLARNPYVQASIGGGLALQVLALLLPPLRKLLGTTPLGLSDWTAVAAGATGPFVANELLKSFRRARKHRLHRATRAGNRARPRERKRNAA